VGVMDSTNISKKVAKLKPIICIKGWKVNYLNSKNLLLNNFEVILVWELM
jgi:hypothetical protein